MQKKIIIEDGLSLKDLTGPGQYTTTIINCLKNSDYKVETIQKSFLEKIKNKNLRRTLYLFWLNTFFIIKLLFYPKNTVVIYTNYSIPFFKIKKIIHIPVIHDLCSYKFEETMTGIQNFYSKMATENAIKKGDCIITVSHTIKNEIVEEFNYPKEKIFITYPSKTYDLDKNITIKEDEFLKGLNLAEKKYILSVSTINRRKNVQSLIDAFIKLDNKFSTIKLVLVGGKGNDSLKNTHQNIIYIGFLSNEELKVLYKNALMYVFPSVYEGFGIPILDAQNFELPLICSDIPVFREIAGEGALFCEPREKDIAEKIKMLAENQELMDKITAAGAKNLEKFDLCVVTDQMVNCLRRFENGK